MNHSSSDRPSPAESTILYVRRARLSHGPASLQAQPKYRPDAPSYPVPRLTDVQADWLRRLSTEFYEMHQRCLTLVILMTSDGDLTFELPPQRCAVEGSTWRFVESDARPDALLLLGTFHALPINRVSDLLDEVPVLDGVHLFYDPRSDNAALHAFFRIDGVVHQAKLGQIIQSTTLPFLALQDDRWTLAESEDSR